MVYVDDDLVKLFHAKSCCCTSQAQPTNLVLILINLEIPVCLLSIRALDL